MQSRKDSKKSITYYFKSTNGETVDAATSKKSAVKPCKKRSRDLDNTPSLHRFFEPNQDKRTCVAESLKQRAADQQPAMVGITYRDDGAGKGALFDHRTIQLSTDTPTAILNTETLPRSFIRTVVETQNLLKFGEQIDRTHFRYPPIKLPQDPLLGLIVIPGVSEKSLKTAEFQLRKEAEIKIIHEALRRGQPVLGICGGSWTLYEKFGGEIRDVEGHNYRGGMPRLAQNNSVPTHNKQMHGLHVHNEAHLLRGAFGKTYSASSAVTVNSVHPKAPCDKTIPPQLQASAMATHDANLAPKNVTCTERTIEAFETVHGVPVLGIQWHPEAYETNTVHSHMLQYMAKAGQRYMQHRKVQQELLTNFTVIKHNLKEQKKYHRAMTVVRRSYTDKTIFFTREGVAKPDIQHLDELKWEIRCKEDYVTEKMEARLKKR